MTKNDLKKVANKIAFRCIDQMLQQTDFEDPFFAEVVGCEVDELLDIQVELYKITEKLLKASQKGEKQ